MTADKSYQKRDQVFISYGTKTTKSILNSYGFVPVDGGVIQSIELINNCVILFDGPLDAAMKFVLGGNYKNKLAVVHDFDSEEMTEILSFIRILTYYDIHTFEALKSNNDVYYRGNEARTIEMYSIKNEYAAMWILKELCELTLDQYPRDLEENEELLETDSSLTVN